MRAGTSFCSLSFPKHLGQFWHTTVKVLIESAAWMDGWMDGRSVKQRGLKMPVHK